MDTRSNLADNGSFITNRILTKRRLVFHGLENNSREFCWNEHLPHGPRRQLEIILLLINFCLHPHQIVGDISRMFFLINIDPRYMDLYKCLSHDDAAKEPIVVKLKRLTMGLVDGSFLAVNTDHHHHDKVSKTHPKLKTVEKIIMNHLYGDDQLGGGDYIEEAIEIRRRLQEIFSMVQMKFSKWRSNDLTLLRIIPKEELSPHEEVACENTETIPTDVDRYEDNITFDDRQIISQSTKYLRMRWAPRKGIFDYHSNKYMRQMEINASKVTNREIPSAIPSKYDSEGLLRLFISKRMLIWQSTLAHGGKTVKLLGRDDQIPSRKIDNHWRKLLKEIKESSKLLIHRHILKDPADIPTTNQLQQHGSSDTEVLAWCIALYLRSFKLKLI